MDGSDARPKHSVNTLDKIGEESFLDHKFPLWTTVGDISRIFPFFLVVIWG